MKWAKWLELSDKTAELSLRERVILAGTALVLVMFVWIQFIFTPLEKLQTRHIHKLTNLNQQIVSQSERVVELTDLLANNPNELLWKHQNLLQQKMLQLKEEIEARLSNLIAPEQMADVMRNVLSDYKGLHLVSARNLPVESLSIHQNETSNPPGKVEGENRAVIFAHGFELVLSGNYFQTLEFLQRLEGMSGFYWRALDYQVMDYPKAEITMEISTLSLEEDWIGV